LTIALWTKISREIYMQIIWKFYFKVKFKNIISMCTLDALSKYILLVNIFI